MNDGANLVIAIHSKNEGDAGAGEFQPFVTFELDAADGRSFTEEVAVSGSEFTSSTERRDVQTGVCSFKGDL